MMTELWQFLLMVGIPTGAVGLGFWAIQRKITRSDAKREAREIAREEHQILLLRASCASLTLGIATAEAVRDGHCNGNVSQALAEAESIKREHERFLQKQGIRQVI